MTTITMQRAIISVFLLLSSSEGAWVPVVDVCGVSCEVVSFTEVDVVVTVVSVEVVVVVPVGDVVTVVTVVSVLFEVVVVSSFSHFA